MLLVDEEAVAESSLEFTSVATSKVPFTSNAESATASKTNDNRRSFAEATVWQLMFPSALSRRA
ncbi:hypothetical protein V7S43_009566 [Phytophthora oleae]|uniref:Uncharacterized protein n=1 Tax=Phytophthora oleae TaxID=2107226 RepID=A0ABD3FIJ9_9STRA